MDLAFNNLQWLICHKNPVNQLLFTTIILFFFIYPSGSKHMYYVDWLFERYLVPHRHTDDQYWHSYIRDILTLHKQKERQNQLIYTCNNI